MKRIILMVIKVLYLIPGLFIRMNRMKKPGAATEEEKLAMLRERMEKANKAGHVTIQPVGLENVPEKDGFLYTPNHQGLYDVLAFLVTSPRPFGVVMKKSVSNIILIKQFRELVGGLALDREDVRDGLRVIKQMSEAVKSGRNFLIFPEGTRSRQGNITGEFKAGPFKAVQYAKCPIVPVAMIDSYRPFDEGHCRPVTVEIHYLKPIPYEEVADLKTHQIAELVKSRIDDEIARTLAAREAAAQTPASE
ncbi:MAG: 1-acyl-sn-glycerol-3-phosphate acyltransferase [Lachnospiraceae bacterium]|nr:1-acyl-sn-glycerol-3-phosphate acyltransferase [Lachnospiraceae bacterium]